MFRLVFWLLTLTCLGGIWWSMFTLNWVGMLWWAGAMIGLFVGTEFLLDLGEGDGADEPN